MAAAAGPGAARSPPLERQVDQAGRSGRGRGGPRPPTAAGSRGRGEAGDRVDLVHEHAALALDEEVDPRHARAVDGPEGLDGQRADALRGLRRTAAPGSGTSSGPRRTWSRSRTTRRRSSTSPGSEASRLVVAEHRHLHLARHHARSTMMRRSCRAAWSRAAARSSGALTLLMPTLEPEVGRLHEAREADAPRRSRRSTPSGSSLPVVAAHHQVLHHGQPVGAEHVLHRDLVHADGGAEHARAHVRAPRPARAGPGWCRPRR